MLPALEIVLEKHREAATELAEYICEQRNSDEGFRRLDSLLEYQVMAFRYLNDAWRDLKVKKS
jgi:hypothetical protein